MTKKEVRETLEKQLQLLSTVSQTATPNDLIGLSQVMVSISYRLKETDLQADDQQSCYFSTIDLM